MLLALTTACTASVYPDGTVCISILHTPGDDPTMYEQASERWSPVQSVEKVILSVISMLAGTISLRRSEVISAHVITTRTQSREWRQYRLLQALPRKQTGRSAVIPAMQPTDWFSRQEYERIVREFVKEQLGL